MNDREIIALGYELRMSAGSEDAEIMIYGSIVSRKWYDDETNTDVTAMEFNKLLKEAKNGGAKRLSLRINSGGGVVFQAVAMRTMLLSAGFDSIDIHIEGLCASAATLLACIPGSKVSISEGSMYMIHNPSGIVWGDANAMEHEAGILRKMEGDVRSIYAKRCGKEDEELKKLMDAETWYTAEEAVEAGFADEMIEGEALEAACADKRVMDTMQGLYRHMPEMRAARENASHEEPKAADGASTEDKNKTKEEKGNMEIKDATREQLASENPELHAQIMQEGARAERERIQEIDELTPAGYEEMAAQAKADGTTAMEFHKQIVKAQKEKGKEFMAKRQKETDPAKAVEGGIAPETDAQAKKQEMDEFAKEMQRIATALPSGGINGGMY